MQNIVPVPPAVVDPKNFISGRKKAIRYIAIGFLILLMSGWSFIGWWPFSFVNRSIAILVSLAIFFLGTIVFLLGIFKLPKVKYQEPPVIH